MSVESFEFVCETACEQFGVQNMLWIAQLVAARVQEEQERELRAA